ncbi:glycosyltransferase family 1 protein [Sporolactobacillus sp. THM7-4]|nr:glycosyltransferase family 1 protein [Sporolactobacillus sp. THM7-4]
MEVAIVTSGYQPVPAALGGGVEALMDHLVDRNEVYGAAHLTVFSTHHEKSAKMAERFQKTSFIFIKPPTIVRLCDRLIYFIVKKILKKEKHMSYRYIVQRLHYIAKVSKYLHQNDYDKVILENHATLFLTLKKYHNAQKYAGRYYYHLHNKVTNDYGCKAIMLSCRKVLGVSHYMNRTIQEFLGDFPSDRCEVLRNCVDTSRFGSTKCRQDALTLRGSFGIAPDQRVVLFTGRLNKEKGIKELLLAFQKVHEPKTTLVIAGGYFYASGMVSDYEKELQKIAEPMKERIVFTGFIDHQDMPAVYGMADVAAIPSMWEDPAPLTVVESMASGLPLITTRSGGIPEYAGTDAAILLERDDQIVDRLADALTHVLTHETLRHQMAEAGRKIAKRLNTNQYYIDFMTAISD